jgi:hypothetical protein
VDVSSNDNLGLYRPNASRLPRGLGNPLPRDLDISGFDLIGNGISA